MYIGASSNLSQWENSMRIGAQKNDFNMKRCHPRENRRFINKNSNLFTSRSRGIKISLSSTNLRSIRQRRGESTGLPTEMVGRKALP